MKIIVSARHFDLTAALKDFAHERLETLKKYFDQVIEVDLVLRVDEHRAKKDNHIAEATLWANGAVLHGEAHGEDMYASIQAVIDKLEKQLKRYKQKLRDNRKRRGRQKEVPPSPEMLEMAVRHAIMAVDHESEDHPRIVRESDFVLQPLTVEEASLQLSEFKRDFVVFSNIETNALGVVYRRSDGDVGWIEAKTALR